MVAAMGILPGAPTRFEDCRDVSFGGVLCTLPALAANGLFEHFEETFPSLGGYCTTLQVVTLLAYMALCRIKTVEQLQYETPGELGKLMGLDRVLEVRCLRKKLTRLFDEKKNGAGALMDYCCYGANLAVVLMGMPRDVLGITGRLVKRDILVEDNAMVVMDYPSGVAAAEASRTQIGKLTGYITALYGTRATLMVEPRAGGRLWLATPDQSEGAGSGRPHAVTPDGRPSRSSCLGSSQRRTILAPRPPGKLPCRPGDPRSGLDIVAKRPKSHSAVGKLTQPKATSSNH